MRSDDEGAPTNSKSGVSPAATRSARGQGLGLRVQGLGFRVSFVGFGVSSGGFVRGCDGRIGVAEVFQPESKLGTMRP